MADMFTPWSDLGSEVQEHVVSLLGNRQARSLRAASSRSRQLVNGQVKSVSISREQADPINTLCLPSRFPNLQTLKLSDRTNARGEGEPFTAAEMYQVLNSGQRWEGLTALSICDCKIISAFSLYVILRTLPQLQCLEFYMPCGDNAPDIVARAITQLSNLQKLSLWGLQHDNPARPSAVVVAMAKLSSLQTLLLQTDDEDAWFTSAELMPLTELQGLVDLEIHNMCWEVMEVVQQLVRLTRLQLMYPVGRTEGDSQELQKLASLTNLQHFWLNDTESDGLDFQLLGTVLCSIPSMRSFSGVNLVSVEGGKVSDVAVVTQLTSMSIIPQMLVTFGEGGDAIGEDSDLSAAMERCLRMPFLQQLELKQLKGPVSDAVLAAPAACSGALRKLRIEVRSLRLASSLLDSVAFRSLKLAELRVDIVVHEEEDRADESLHSIVAGICSQASLHKLGLSVDIRNENDGWLKWPEGMWLEIARRCLVLEHIELAEHGEAGGVPLAGLHHLSSLESLQLTMRKLADDDLVHLIDCPKLQAVEFVRCSAITEDALTLLRLAMPQLREVIVKPLGAAAR